MKNLQRALIVLALILSVALVPCCAGKPAPKADLARGGALYDQWWVVTGAAAPTGNHPLWATQSTNTRQGTDTWRCKECHGWDYLGKDGAYGSGSHLTGFPEIFSAANQEGILDILKGGNNPNHNFSAVLSESDLADLSSFVSSGLIDSKQYINYDTKKPISADAASGAEAYAVNCASCHGSNGRQLNFGSSTTPEYLGDLSRSNPWEVLHKIRFGQPGTAMPSGYGSGWILPYMINILAHSQTIS